jgi:alkylhydroperoxidase/carboxymuconolactone decarboxylase family protein YurZ
VRLRPITQGFGQLMEHLIAERLNHRGPEPLRRDERNHEGTRREGAVMPKQEKDRMTDEEWLADWTDMLGSVPPFARALHDISEVADEAYRRQRRWIVQERTDGLSSREKELLMMALSIAAANRDGAVNHMLAARRHGLTETQLREALAQCFLIVGAMEFVRTGQVVWQEWRAQENST